MARTRQDAARFADEWDDSLLWYARGVQALQSRGDLNDVTSWRYLAAMHGLEETLWREFGYLASDEELPQTDEFNLEDKDQCQHHNWYFLPWHRGYLSAFEKIVLAAIVELGGPADWALPYWNYSDEDNPKARSFPAAFASQAWPDDGDNPLYVARRYGRGNGEIVIRKQDVDLRQPLGERAFAGTTTGGAPGFGGAATPFQHDADRRAEGFLEQAPHDVMHGVIGGFRNDDDTDWRNLGLMSHPGTAALDPIFWLHHANLDRLWDVWLRRDQLHENPGELDWLDGPAGPRIFIMPAPDGSRRQFRAREMLDTTAPDLDYEYEDVSDPLGGQTRFEARRRTLGLETGIVQERAMAKKPKVELLGANASAVRLAGKLGGTSVRIDKETNRKVAESFAAARQETAAEPDRVFLNLENITGTNDAAVFDVYVGLAPDQDPEEHQDLLAGVVSLFGVSSATKMSDPHGGAGLNKVIEITDIVDRLHLAGPQDLDELPVRFVAANSFGSSGVQIGRVSIYRQGD